MAILLQVWAIYSTIVIQLIHGQISTSCSIMNTNILICMNINIKINVIITDCEACMYGLSFVLCPLLTSVACYILHYSIASFPGHRLPVYTLTFNEKFHSQDNLSFCSVLKPKSLHSCTEYIYSDGKNTFSLHTIGYVLCTLPDHKTGQILRALITYVITKLWW